MSDSIPITSDKLRSEEGLRAAIKAEPTNAKLISRLARLLLNQGSFDESVRLFEAAVAAAPEQSRLVEDLAHALIRKGDLLAADLWFSRLIASGRQERRDELQNWMRKEAKLLLRRARGHEQAGRLDDALAAYELAVAHAPQILIWRLEAAEFFLSVGRYDAALTYLEEAPDDERVTTLRQLALDLRVRNPTRRSADFAQMLHRKAVADLKAGRAVLAEPVLRELTLRYPDQPDSWVQLRAARMALGKTAEADAVAEIWAAESPSTVRFQTMGFARPISPRGLLFDMQDSVPLVAKEAALTQVHTPEELKHTPDSYLIIDPGKRVVQARPFFQAEDDTPPPSIPITTSESFVLALDNAMVAGRGAVITQKGEIVADQFFPQKADKYLASVHEGRVTFRPEFGEEPIKVEYVDTEAFLCMGPTDRAYGDWLNQFPPRLWLAEAAKLDCPILVNRDTFPNYLEMLEAVGVPRDRLIFQKVPRAVVYRRLYAPSWPYGWKNRPMKDWLKIYKRAARPPTSRERPLLFLTRKQIGNRRLVNEEEICELFVRHGFKEVVPEALDLSQTIELFSNPACVAGPWGSAFQSMVFSCTPPVSLALIPRYNEKYMRSVGTYMDNVGVRFGYVFGDCVRRKHGPNVDPWTMPLEKAKRALDRTLELVEQQRTRQPEPVDVA